MWDKLKDKLSSWQSPAASSAELVLGRRRIFIVPSQSGFAFAMLLILIFTASVNYSLNLGYALTFILAASAITNMLFTYRNLAGLGLLANGGQPVFVGEVAQYRIHLRNHNALPRHAIAIGLSKESMHFTDVASNNSHDTILGVIARQRGWQRCPKIRLQTTFPSGLFSAWAYWQTNQDVLVYPEPEQQEPPLPYITSAANTNTNNINTHTNQDEFIGIRHYRQGDPPKHLAWRQMARQSNGSNDVLLSKHFAGNQKETCLLDLASLPSTLSTEQKISRLCAWVLAAERQGHLYGFSAGKHQLAPASGEQHQHACLTLLALFSPGQAQ